MDEAGILNGDGDINGDGKGDGTDTDSDGILSVFDSFSGFGNTGKPLPTNTFGTGNPDYLKLVSKMVGIYDISSSLYASLDANNDGKIDGSTDVDKDGILDAFDTNTATYGSPRDLSRKLCIDFDGRNDYAQAAALLAGQANVTLMAWIDFNTGFSGDGLIVGQDKFQLRVTSSRQLQVVANTTTLTYSSPLSRSQWYHVAAVYGGGLLKLYLNGTLVTSTSAAGNIAADTSLLTIGKDPSSNTKYFKGKIDEIRIFNSALTIAQLQRMVYQEIQNTAAQVRGTVIPKDIGTLPWTNLLRYYKMDAYKDDITDDLTTASIDTGTGMKMYNIKNIFTQQAPMPFVTERTGDFATAVNSTSNEIRGLDIIDSDWSIVSVKHNITEPANTIDLGMIVDSGITVMANNNNKIQNDWYLMLNGKIDLVGRSQLLQTTSSDLDITSSGSIERDQQGQSSKYNYNFWSSPVGPISPTSNNNAYTVSGVMRDGTNPSVIQNIIWTPADNGAPTSPITLSSRWIYKFQNVAPLYENWSSIGQNGSLPSGIGYIMKGCGAATPNQNYTFVGKPNNGTITNPIAANNSTLLGNPYASAIDLDKFITDNTASTTGTIYFWEHYSTNYSHELILYQGGYASRSLVGGTPPVSPAGISGLGSSTRVPGRFVPVGQGFFVRASATGGTITFNNSQRTFIKEDNVQSNVMFRSQQHNSETVLDNADDDAVTEDHFARIRLGFTVENQKRQLLLGFMENRATSGYDVGYDAPPMEGLENLPNDMLFLNSDYKLVIQGDGYFSPAKIFPLEVKIAREGNVIFSLDAIENFDTANEIFIYDTVTNTYHDIRNTPFEIFLPAGTSDDRFSLRFQNSTLAAESFMTIEPVIRYTNNNDVLVIVNSQRDTDIISVSLFNLLGQNLDNWNITDQKQFKIEIALRRNSGSYLVKVHTSKGDFFEKIMVR